MTKKDAYSILLAHIRGIHQKHVDKKYANEEELHRYEQYVGILTDAFIVLTRDDQINKGEEPLLQLTLGDWGAPCVYW